jgi:tRNA G18 (ribose-2'-O)-methylase SpoU
MAATSFCLGIATALASIYVYDAFLRRRKGQQSNDSHSTPPKKTVNTTHPELLMDTPDLDLRLIRKAEAVIMGRTDKVVVVVERCTSDHNYSAILRTTEALGIQTCYIIDPPPETFCQADGAVVAAIEDDDEQPANKKARPIKLTESEQKAHAAHRLFAQNATEWLTIHEYATTAECLQALKQDGYAVWVTDLSQEAVPLLAEHVGEQDCMPEKVAIVMGTEAVGCSQEMLEAASLRVYLPLAGFADSLNLSVATAMIIQRVFMLAPHYAGSMDESQRIALRQAWFPKLARQRLMSSSDKRRCKILKSLIHKGEKIQQKGDSLSVEQQKKIDLIPQYMAELQALEDKANFQQAESAVAHLVDNPPAPLTDLRRADSHRVTFVGKKTKKNNEGNWKNMVATNNTGSEHMTTAAYFRECVKEEK